MTNMLNSNSKLVGPTAIVCDILLTGLFFVFMTFVLKAHVPTDEAQYQLIFGTYGSSCLSGVFWLALQCFRVTFTDQKQNPQDS
jgi:hypothetical protein